MRTVMKFLSLVVLLSFTAAGCGSGDTTDVGGGGGGTPASLNTVNAVQGAGVVMNMVGSTFDAGDLGGVITGAVVKRPGTGLNLADFTKKQLEKMISLEGQPGSAAVGVVFSYPPMPCSVSGSVGVVLNDTNNDLELSEGDTITITYNNCVELGLTTNGRMSLTLNSQTGDLVFPPYSFSVTATFNNLRINDGFSVTSVNGSFTMGLITDALGNDTISLDGSSLSISDGGFSATLSNFSFGMTFDYGTSDYTTFADGRVYSSTIGGYVDFVTLVTFEGVDPNNPHVGVMRITGANNSSVIMTVLDSTWVSLALDADGDGFVDPGYPINVLWDSL